MSGRVRVRRSCAPSSLTVSGHDDCHALRYTERIRRVGWVGVGMREVDAAVRRREGLLGYCEVFQVVLDRRQISLLLDHAVLRDPDSRQNGDDHDYDHDFDQCEPASFLHRLTHVERFARDGGTGCERLGFGGIGVRQT